MGLKVNKLLKYYTINDITQMTALTVIKMGSALSKLMKISET